MLRASKIINAKLPGYKEPQQICIDEQGIIESIQSMSAAVPPQSTQGFLDVKGDWLSLGGIDLQINGALGLAFPNLHFKHIPTLHQICRFLWQEGIDGFLPTLVTTSVENIARSLSIIDDFMAIQSHESIESAKILGVHLEGPFLNYEKRGAHAAQYLLTPTVETVEWLLGDCAHVVKIITLAPELDPTGDVIPYLRSRGIVVSLGHTQATAEEAKRAFELGATLVTHAFNAMPALHHRKPGLLGEAMLQPHVACGLIADGQHVCPTMIDILLRASHYERGVFLISDALAPIGLEDGIYPWDDRQIEVKQGTAKLADGTLAGTTLPLFVGVANLVQWGLCDLGTAIALATESPRRAIHLPGICLGQPAHLVRWHWNESTSQLQWQRIKIKTD